MIALTIQEIRHLLLRLGQHFGRRLSQFQTAAWSCWRRLHQTQAQNYHRQRRALKIVLADLQL